MSELPEGYNEIDKKPADCQLVSTTTLWCGEWRYGSAMYQDGQYWSEDGQRMLDTPSGWKP